MIASSANACYTLFHWRNVEMEDLFSYLRSGSKDSIMLVNFRDHDTTDIAYCDILNCVEEIPYDIIAQLRLENWWHEFEYDTERIGKSPRKLYYIDKNHASEIVDYCNSTISVVTDMYIHLQDTMYDITKRHDCDITIFDEADTCIINMLRKLLDLCQMFNYIKGDYARDSMFILTNFNYE